MRKVERPYYKQTQRQLKDYGKLLRNIALCKTQLANLQEDYNAISVPTICTDRVGGVAHGVPASQVERQAERRERIQERIKQVQYNLSLLELNKRKITRSIDALSKKEKELVTRRYIQRQSYAKMEADTYLSSSYIGRVLQEATEQIAFMLYGFDGLTA